MPNDTLFITILREPVTQFESLFDYHELFKTWSFDFDAFNNESAVIPSLQTRRAGRFGINQMMFDLGFDDKLFNDEKAVQQYIERLDSIFNLVMINERMDESLILLKRLLCWTTDDIITFKVSKPGEEFEKFK